ncbi:MAG: MBOAT family protein [Lachnospiraceae bacterium]|nr:MBOAT family protein [Lachnospiraceae bacterium]
MLFNSVRFLIFFPAVVFVYAFIPRKIRALWLLVASYFFYMSWNAKYALLIALSTVVTWAGGLVLSSVENRSRAERRAVLALVFTVNLGILFFFKYFRFALDTISSILKLFGGGAIHSGLDVLLPVGISFYTFQALGYCADVYHGRVQAERNLLHYALFVSFFPQLVAGPIERSGNLLKQIDDIENINIRNYDQVISGLLLMLWGYFQKVVIADRIAILADTVFDEPARFGTTALLIGALAFTLQIYCDFGAYSSIAIGAARVMGFRLSDNFNTPYFAESIADFWHRWHISLSTWFRDYVYIPLGGNRCSRVRRYLNLMITFLLSGLWHGAAWTYVIWGGLHGFYQIAGDFLSAPLRRIGDWLKVNRAAESWHLLRMALTFALTSFAWIFFRAASLSDALFYIGRLFTRPDPWSLFDGSIYALGLDVAQMHVLAFSLALLFLVDLLRARRHQEPGDFLKEQNLWFRFAVPLMMILVILVYGAYGVDFDSARFIYFTF